MVYFWAYHNIQYGKHWETTGSIILALDMAFFWHGLATTPKIVDRMVDLESLWSTTTLSLQLATAP